MQQLPPRKSGVILLPCSNFVAALKHNKRAYIPHYAHSELTHENESLDIADIAQYVDDVKSAYIARTGKRMPSNTVYLREAVFVLEARHTMDDMRRATNEIESKLGLKALHISIHRDEGKSKEERNWHAHVIFGTIGPDGKTVKLGKKELITLQDIAASALGMERTPPFKGRKHIPHKVYRRIKEEAEKEGQKLVEARVRELIDKTVAVDEEMKGYIEARRILEDKVRQAEYRARQAEEERDSAVADRKTTINAMLKEIEIAVRCLMGQRNWPSQEEAPILNRVRNHIRSSIQKSPSMSTPGQQFGDITR